MENCRLSNNQVFIGGIHKEDYIINLIAMKQPNVQTGFQREIRSVLMNNGVNVSHSQSLSSLARVAQLQQQEQQEYQQPQYQYQYQININNNTQRQSHQI